MLLLSTEQSPMTAELQLKVILIFCQLWLKHQENNEVPENIVNIFKQLFRASLVTTHPKINILSKAANLWMSDTRA